MYRIRTLDAVTRELAGLDKPVGRRIVERIHRLAENLDEVKPEPLTGDLAGLYKLRVGNYRVIYERVHDETDDRDSRDWSPRGNLPKAIKGRKRTHTPGAAPTSATCRAWPSPLPERHGGDTSGTLAQPGAAGRRLVTRGIGRPFHFRHQTSTLP